MYPPKQGGDSHSRTCPTNVPSFEDAHCWSRDGGVELNEIRASSHTPCGTAVLPFPRAVRLSALSLPRPPSRGLFFPSLHSPSPSRRREVLHGSPSPRGLCIEFTGSVNLDQKTIASSFALTSNWNFASYSVTHVRRQSLGVFSAPVTVTHRNH